MNACEIEPIIPHDILNTPWMKVAMDIFHLGGKPYLSLVDYTTSFFDINQLTRKLSCTVAVTAKYLFGRYDMPKVIISENSPEFTGSTFKTFS